MLFLNPWLLIGLGGVLIPIILHMMRRQAAKPLDWGAMRFLFDTVAMRRRRMEWEDMLLMAARCLLFSLIALALARPFVPPDSAVPWVFVLPLVLLGVAVLGASFVLSNRRWRWMIRGGAVILLLSAGGLILLERQLNLKRFQTTGSRDVALVIDASTSMEMRGPDGRTSFERAVEDAMQLVKEAPRGTSFSVILGGPAPQQMTGAPLTHRADVIEVLQSLRPIGGLFRAHEAIGISLLNLSKGYHPAKEVIVFSDGQRAGWRAESPSAWKSLGDAASGLPQEPKLVLRTYAPPEALRNVAVSSLTLSRAVVGTDREVTVEVTVENTGTEAVTPERLRLTVGKEELAPAGVGQLAPGQEETIEVRYRFKQTGPVVVAARLETNDDLAEDDRRERVVNVKRRLPVLLVDGNPGGGFFERAAGFTALALAPSRELVRGVDPEENSLMAPEMVAAPDLPRIEDLERFRVIVLADVVRLPARVERRIASFVAGGGGLLILAGARVEEGFYNAWSGPDGVLAPVTIGALKVDEVDLAPAPETFDHESLVLFEDEKQSDLGEATISGFREVGEVVRGGSVSARFSNGEPLMAGRNYGKGRVLMVTTAFDSRTGNLPTKQAFVPLVHELVTWLAGAGGVELNVDALWGPAVALPGGGGLMATYYRSDKSKDGVAVRRIDPAVHFNWEYEAPYRGMNKNGFKVRWEGHLLPPVTGDYVFEGEVDGDDSLAMTLDGELILNAKPRGKSKTLRLEGGEPIPVSIDYREEYAGAAVSLFWTPPGGTREVLPARVLIPVTEDSGSQATAEGGAIDPLGAPRELSLSVGRRGRMLEIDGVAIPGLYQLTVPGELREEIEDLEGGEVPLVVKRDVRESRLTSLDDDDRAMMRREFDVVEARSVEDLRALLSGKGFGMELWKILAIASFFLLLLEVALARWISKSRRSAEEVRVEFEELGGSAEGIVDRVDKLKRAG